MKSENKQGKVGDLGGKTAKYFEMSDMKSALIRFVGGVSNTPLNDHFVLPDE